MEGRLAGFWVRRAHTLEGEALGIGLLGRGYDGSVSGMQHPRDCVLCLVHSFDVTGLVY